MCLSVGISRICRFKTRDTEIRLTSVADKHLRSVASGAGQCLEVVDLGPALGRHRRGLGACGQHGAAWVPHGDLCVGSGGERMDGH